MKNNKRIGMVAILLIVGIVALSAAPAFAQGRAVAPVQGRAVATAPRSSVQQNQAVQQRVMMMDCTAEDCIFDELPAELQAQIEERRAEAELRQAAGGQYQGGGRGQRGGSPQGGMAGGRGQKAGSPQGGYGRR
ncbi:hypothetical protein [uncultured Sphaerochaeta sp.]|uniref:hypothetical protein n=1 Tax=uncultured Sphaerochaeta sp. TaxID=886478 RepID=UPI002A0A816F|nr:hypothetical protein [uncultured Sphaerochaeta sp.]